MPDQGAGFAIVPACQALSSAQSKAHSQFSREAVRLALIDRLAPTD